MTEEWGCFMLCHVTREGRKGNWRSQYLPTNTPDSLLGELTVRANSSVPLSPGTHAFAPSLSSLCCTPDSQTHTPLVPQLLPWQWLSRRTGRGSVSLKSISWALYVTKPEGSVSFPFLVELHMVPIDRTGSCVARLWIWHAPWKTSS